MVGLGRIELPTSPLSGVRSSQLSYRPKVLKRPENWWSWSGSNRRPPECKSGALPAELQPLMGGFSNPPPTKIFSRPIGRKDRADQPRSHLLKLQTLSGDPKRTPFATSLRSQLRGLEWNGCHFVHISDSTHVLS